MSIFFNICIGLLAAGTIAMMLGLIGMGIADRKERKTAERLENERKNGEADVFPEIEEQLQEEESATKQPQEDTTKENKVRVKIFDKVAPRKVLYSDDCKYCRYGGYGDERLCKYLCSDCDNSEVNIDGEPPVCHCFDILKVESKRPQCPYFKDKIEG